MSDINNVPEKMLKACADCDLEIAKTLLEEYNEYMKYHPAIHFSMIDEYVAKKYEGIVITSLKANYEREKHYHEIYKIIEKICEEHIDVVVWMYENLLAKDNDCDCRYKNICRERIDFLMTVKSINLLIQ